MSKKIIIFLVSAAFLLLITGFFFLSKSQQKQNNNFLDNFRYSSSCAKEGQGIGTCTDCITKCCTGLKAMSHLKYNNECVKFPAPGLGATCSKCGNGICDKQNKEDECNCPEDCK